MSKCKCKCKWWDKVFHCCLPLAIYYKIDQMVTGHFPAVGIAPGDNIAFWALLSPCGRYYRPRDVIIALRALLSPSGCYYRPVGVIIASGAILSPCDYRPGRYSQGDNNAPEAIITPTRR